ncbi:MAG: exosortase [Betaproteobacteria bacterium]|nr:exosortase [Betaproteobacteria bacterium]
MAPAHAPFLPQGRAASVSLPSLLPLVAGWCVLYGPIYAQLAKTLWQDEANNHAPLVAAVIAALLWAMRRDLSALPPPRRSLPGLSVLAAGLVLAVTGALSDFPLLSMASQIPVLAGIVLMLCGAEGVRRAWFPLLFLAFMVPLPGIFLDALTGQLKELLSAMSVDLLHALGYPAARSGVVIVVGQYQLLMADACSGLHSLVSLAALGLLYVHLIAVRGGGQGWRGGGHAALMFAAIIPIALGANLVRVLLLALITYHAGDAAGRQWHEAMGVLVFLAELAMLIVLDSVLVAAARYRATRQAT